MCIVFVYTVCTSTSACWKIINCHNFAIATADMPCTALYFVCLIVLIGLVRQSMANVETSTSNGYTNKNIKRISNKNIFNLFDKTAKWFRQTENEKKKVNFITHSDLMKLKIKKNAMTALKCITRRGPCDAIGRRLKGKLRLQCILNNFVRFS